MQVVVIGHCPVTTERLATLAARVRTPSDVDDLARALPGSFHLVVLIDDQLRVQGSVTGLRRVSYAYLQGMPIAADRADVLADLTGADVDQDMLATRAVCGGMLPSPLRDHSMWRGVYTVPPDHFLLLKRDRTAREVSWWGPPAPELSLEQGAPTVRAALITATADRRPPEGRLSVDLSGGMDSTSLCFLAAHHVPDLLTFRWGEAEEGNDDAHYATHAARCLPQADHLVMPQAKLPAIFTDPAAPADPEQPYLFSRTLARTRHTALNLAAHGSRQHIAGHGADELFFKFPGYLHRLLLRHPLTGLRHLRGHLAVSRWPLSATVRELTRGGDVASWWRAQADELAAPLADRFPPIGWGFSPLRAQPWVTDEALDATRRTLRRTADQVRPFAEDRGQHQFLLALRTTAPAYAQMGRIFAESGVRLEMPYLDDRVVEAALAVQLHERVTPLRYKPLLAQAMQGIAPPVVLNRSTKGDFAEDLRVGRRRNLAALLEVFAESELARHGLIDTGMLRGEILAPQADNTKNIALEHLLGCETWFRTATTRHTSSRRNDVRNSAS
ncbi:asparagine synthase-related protein [Streptomyces kanamyceticus]|uniref:asparagine synthase-related protein n=1 Tax=Streptomyces kanamyceticus TaxID=1967 RepID=UPI000A4177E4|nr:asparagine synthase-related protein [Streptomyces kanamyceticus]